MLSRADDYPIHQTPEPIAVSGDNRNFYDRYFFNGYARNRDAFFALALGVYPNLGVIDAALAVIVEGVQTNVRASRALGGERTELTVGPLRLSVDEPLRSLTLRCDAPDAGVEAALTFRARTEVQQEPRFTRRIGTLTFMDYTRMTQNGTWSGHVAVDGTHLDVTPAEWWGTRDRSWGLRPVGARDPQPNPAAGEPQFWWLWAPMNFPEFAVLFHRNEDATGGAWNRHAQRVPLLDAHGVSATPAVTDRCERPRITFASGTRHAAAAELPFTDADGGAWVARLRPRYPFYMKGIGYGHPEWNHGSWQGPSAWTHDRYVLADMAPDDPTNLHIQAVSDVVLEGPQGTVEGMGTLEQLFLGAHDPSGFRSLLDPAP